MAVVLAAMRQQLDRLVHVTSSFRTEAIDGFVERIVAASPANITRVHPKVSGGSSANEGAIKMAQRATGKQEVITLFRSHLGQTIVTASMSGNAFRSRPIPITHPGVIKVPDPYCRRCFYSQDGPDQCAMQCVERIADFIEYASAGRVAAIVVEPISGNGGNIVSPPGYLTRLREFCDQNDIVLIFDEIQTGIGRTGEMFAAQHFGVGPDAITAAKGLGGSGAQVAAILTNDRLSCLSPNDHSFTYGSNVLALAAANATLDIISQRSFLEIDHVAEEAVFEFLRKKTCCRAALYSEDRGYIAIQPNPEYLFVVDPIDGTRPAAAALEMATVAVAVARHAADATLDDVIGAALIEIESGREIYGDAECLRSHGYPFALPRLSEASALSEMFWSVELNGHPMGLMSNAYGHVVDASANSGAVFVFNSASFSISRIITGQMDAYVDIGNRVLRDHPETEAAFRRAGRGSILHLFPYDIAAVVFLAGLAGVTITDAYGNSLGGTKLTDMSPLNQQSCVAACTPKLHATLIESINWNL
jgi:acetylornithine/succinyldiaminopimelate/putrescine aminotransferase